MEKNSNLNHLSANDLTNLLLIGTYFEGYSFDTSFSLRFGRDSKKNSQGKELPTRLELILLNDWWFSSHEEWKLRLKLFPCHETVEPEEPVQAFELANLRWSGNSTIISVELNDEFLILIFKNGKQISVSCEPTEGESWILRESGIDENYLKWSVVCENNEYYLRVP